MSLKGRGVQVGGGGGSLFKWVDPGANLEGIWEGTHAGRFGDLGTITLPNGRPITFPVHTVLGTKLSRVRLKEEIYIEYLGKTKGKSGVEYKDFLVVVDSTNALLPADEAGEPEVPF